MLFGAQVHVLEAHPCDPRLLLSAGYDGQLLLWDVLRGAQAQSFSTADTCPVRGGRWSDPLQVVDGHFSPDGTSLVVSDVAGQVGGQAGKQTHVRGTSCCQNIKHVHTCCWSSANQRCRGPGEQAAGRGGTRRVRNVEHMVAPRHRPPADHTVCVQAWPKF